MINIENLVELLIVWINSKTLKCKTWNIETDLENDECKYCLFDFLIKKFKYKY